MTRWATFWAALAMWPAAARPQTQMATLAGEGLQGDPAQMTTTVDCNVQGGTSTGTFTVSGTAVGPYPGTFTETGTFTINNPSPTVGGSGDVVTLQAQFTIWSGATTITGTKTLHDVPFSGESGWCHGPDAFYPGDSPGEVVAALVLWTATISGPEGTAVNRGTGYLVFQDRTNEPELGTIVRIKEFGESFDTAEALGSASLTMGPQAMEGDLKVAPGTVLKVGYDFTMPGSHAAADVTFAGAKVVFNATCVTGSGGGVITVPMPDATYSDPAGSSAWLPSGDQKSPLVFQGSIAVPDLCHGGLVRLQQGGTFTAQVMSADTTDKINVRWHYSANGSSGSWSGTKTVIPQ